MKCFSLILSVGITACSLTDLRQDLTAPISNGPVQDPRAQEIIDSVLNSYGGRQKWESVKRTSLTYSDAWPGIMFRLGGPWIPNTQQVQHSFWNGTFDSEMKLLNGPEEGLTWKYYQGDAFKIIAGRQIATPDNDVEFYLPTYQYFVEFPYRLTEIPILKYGGDTTFKQLNYHLIFGTWQTVAPNEKFDQYVIWVNKETFFIDYLSYTIRDKGKALSGTMNYSDFRDIDGITIPFDQLITFLPHDGVVVHHIKVESASLEFRHD